MALVKQIDAAEMAKRAVVLDLGDLARQGQRILEQARIEAAKIVEDGRKERARLIENADKVGYQQGFNRGLDEGRKTGFADGAAQAVKQRAVEIEKIELGWAQALSEFIADRQRLMEEAQLDVTRLAVMLAEKVTKRVIDADPTIIERQMAEVLGHVLRSTRLVVVCNPDDEEILEGAMPRLLAVLQNQIDVTMATDESIVRGGCQVRLAETASGPGGRIDATIDGQMARLTRELLPEGA
jgi:flagellar assembly protein FliH